MQNKVQSKLFEGLALMKFCTVELPSLEGVEIQFNHTLGQVTVALEDHYKFVGSSSGVGVVSRQVLSFEMLETCSPQEISRYFISARLRGMDDAKSAARPIIEKLPDVTV